MSQLQLQQQQYDVRQLLFSNMLALGMDPIGLERKWRIPFNKDMFALPNKKGFEVVMYFLFTRLNPVMCQEQFKGCWPIKDKKDEQNFRKVCRDWLQTIATDDASANLPLPRIVASLFMSPGGEKIYQLLFYFSTYILEHCIRNENGVRTHEFLQRPVLDKQNRTMSCAMVSAVKAGTARLRRQFIDHSEQAVSVQQEWKVYGSELVKSYRTLCRDIRDLEQHVKEEVNLAAEKCAARGSPLTGRRKSGIPQYDFDVQSVHRAQRLRKVRELWKSVEDFMRDYQKDREVIDSILEGTQDAYCIDAKELNLRIPDLLLRECEQEIQRRNVDNVYQGGKLNLVSLIHLWNLALHLYIEKLHQTGLPNLEEVTPKVTTQVHTHQAHLTNTQHLRSKLKNQTIPKLKKDIRTLRDRLDSQVFRAKSPDSIRMTSLGLGFMPPTPPVNFSGVDADPNSVPGNESIRMPPEQVSTPEAASVLMDNINKRVQAKEMSKLVQGTPVFATRLATQGQPLGRNTIPTSKLPVKESINYERIGNKQRTQHQRVTQTGPASTNEVVSTTPSGTTLHQTSLEVSEGARQAIRAQVSKPHVKENKSNKFKSSTKTAKSTKKNPASSSKPAPTVERHGSKNSPKALDILADQIADAVMYGADSTNFRHVIGGSDLDLAEKMGDTQAFLSKDKLCRTPPNQSPRSQDSLGPLSSTRIEQSASDVERGATDRVVTKLFTDEGSDEDDGSIITVTSEPGPRHPPFSQRRQHPSGCEDDNDSTMKPATSSAQTSPVADRVRDMSPGVKQSISSRRSDLPDGRSLALTSGALVITGNLLGMTEKDHISSVRRPVQRSDWGNLSDSGSESNTEQISGAEGVAALPESTDTDSVCSQGHIGIYTLRPPLNQNVNNSSRNVIGAEAAEVNGNTQTKDGQHTKYRLSSPEIEDDTGSITSETLPKYSQGGEENMAKCNSEGLLISDATYQSDVDNLTELVNASTRVVELQNKSLTEQSEPSLRKTKTAFLTDHDNLSLGGGFSRNSGTRGSFRDVEQNVLQSFVSSSLQALTHSLAPTMGAADRLGRHSPVRSRSPRNVDTAIKASTELNAADIITRYKLLKERQAVASLSNKKNNASPGSTASSSVQSSPTGSPSHTPELTRRSPIISEKYLQRTPTREDPAMSKRFSLNLDDVEDTSNVSPLRPVFTGGRHLQFGSVSISPLASPQTPSDSPQQPKRESLLASTYQSLKPPGPGSSPYNTVAATPMSPVIDALHTFELEPSITGRMSIDNIFDEEGPALVPLSPVLDEQCRQPHKSPEVVKLIDL